MKIRQKAPTEYGLKLHHRDMGASFRLCLPGQPISGPFLDPQPTIPSCFEGTFRLSPFAKPRAYGLAGAPVLRQAQHVVGSTGRCTRRLVPFAFEF